MDLRELAKEYAALLPEWAKPGMRCVDPETEVAFRVVDPAVLDPANPLVSSVGRFNTVGGFCDDLEAECAAFDRAIAAGPDLDDAATVGALLLGLPNFSVNRVMSWTNNDGRQVRWGTQGLQNANTLAEAIIRACIAQAKEGK